MQCMLWGLWKARCDLYRTI